MLNRKDRMVLTVDERRRMAAMFAIFVRVDERGKSAKKSKSSKIKKARSPTYLGRGPDLWINVNSIIMRPQNIYLYRINYPY